MASPHAAGVAALIHAQGVTDPDDVREILEATADDLGTPCRDDLYGWGLVNAHLALLATQGQLPTADPNGPYTDDVDSPITFDGTGSSDPDGAITSYNWDFGDGSTGTGSTPTHTYTSEDVFTVTLRVIDDDGLPSRTVCTIATVQNGGPCPAELVSPESVEELHEFRDNVLASSTTGQELTDLYYEHSSAVSEILLADSTLTIRSAAVLRDMAPGIRFLLGERGGRNIAMTPLRVARITGLFADIGSKGDGELREMLSMLSDSLEKYKGKRISQIWQSID